ncbi:MAG TPA: sulfotransferase [Saprospiraceae bacterium]|nr:sulfotransferase [Saprospiraceae bacterium]HMQ83909.1 sulfotransferase [Saprospiraceae bacterium]
MNNQSIFPNVFIAGAQKAGTTSLHFWLASHPEVFAPEGLKDFHFFSKNEHYEKGATHLDELFRPGYKNQKVVLDSSVNYLYFPYVAERIHQWMPDAKIIIQLRNPIHRALSAYHFNFKYGIEENGLETALRKELQTPYSDRYDLENFTYLEHGLYDKQLRRFYDFFPEQQVIVSIFEEVLPKKAAFMQEIFEFVGIDASFTPAFEHANETGKARFRSINKLVTTDNPLKQSLRQLFKIDRLPQPIKYRIRQLILKANTSSVKKKEMLSQEMKSFLVDYYSDSVAELEKLLQKPLKPLWTEFQ